MNYSINDPELVHAMEAYRLEQPPDRESKPVCQECMICDSQMKTEDEYCSYCKKWRFWERLQRLMKKHGKLALVSNFVVKGGER